MLKLIRERKELILVIGLPVVSVMMGIATVFFAYGGSDTEVIVDSPKLSKTSWRSDP